MNKLRSTLRCIPPSGLSLSRVYSRPLAVSTKAVGDESKRVSGINLCPKECLCKRKDIEVSYKNVRLLSQFVSSQTGMILPKTVTKLCMKKQQEIGKAIKLARSIGFMPYTYKALDYLEDPKLFK